MYKKQVGSEVKKYNKNPITEVLIDIHIEPILSVSPNDIEQIHDVFKDEFPEKRTRRTIEATLQIKQSTSTKQQHQATIDGFQFWKADKTEVLQCRMDGFSYSRLKPYDHWEVHFPKMIYAWKKYAQTFKPLKVKRAVVRFVNLFEIPQTVFELKDYFNSSPEPPESLTQSLENYFQRLVINGDSGEQAMIIFTTSRPTKPNTTPILLDIGVSQNVSFPVGGKSLQEKLEELHLFAKKVFEAYITDKMRDLIK